MSQTRIFNVSEVTDKQLLQAARDLEQGAVAVLPTDTVYGIGTAAGQEKSIQTIYRLKNRPATSPLQLLRGSVEQVKQEAVLSVQAQRLALAFWPGGLTLILPPTQRGEIFLRGFAGLGFRVPNHPFLLELLKRMSVPLACTSANLHGQDVITNEKMLLDTFEGKADYIFCAGTLSPVASSVVDMTGTPKLLREGALTRKQLEQIMGGVLDIK